MSKDKLIELLQDAHGDIYIHQVILGASAVPKEWHPKANELLDKWRPVTAKIEAIAEAFERRET